MIENTLKSIIAEVLECSKESITDDSGLTTHPGWDSLHHVMIIVQIEKTFNTEFQDDEIERLISFSSLRKHLGLIK